MVAAVASICRSTSTLTDGECASPSARLTKLLPSAMVGTGGSFSALATARTAHKPELPHAVSVLSPTTGTRRSAR